MKICSKLADIDWAEYNLGRHEDMSLVKEGTDEDVRHPQNDLCAVAVFRSLFIEER